MSKVSVIVPIYNANTYIRKCVTSLFGQTLDDVEYIFVDDASIDNSIEIIKEILKSYPNRTSQCRFIYNERNCGVSFSRNKGLKVATAEFVCFCDNDDWLDTNMLFSMYDYAICYNSDLVLCDAIAVYNNRQTELLNIKFSSTDRINALKKYISSTWNPIWNMLVKRRLFYDYNIFFPEGKNMCEDYYVSTKLLLNAVNPIHIDKAYYYYNRSNLSSFLHNQNDKSNQMKIDVNLDLINYFKDEGKYETYEKELCWRLLNAKQELCFYRNTYREFISIFPESHKYILSCPYLSMKVKLAMFCLTHHLRFVSEFLSLCRRLKYNL